MRASFLKASRVAILGAFLSQGHYSNAIHVKMIPVSCTNSETTVVVQRGLHVSITPELKFTDEGQLEDLLIVKRQCMK